MKHSEPKKISILGSTGSIGKSTIDIIENNKNFAVESLTAKSSADILATQAKKLSAKFVAIYDENEYTKLKEILSGTKIEIAAGEAGILEAASKNVDVAIAGIVGAACLKPALVAAKNAKVIGLANKECLVCAGEIFIDEVRKTNTKIVPVDSEHNAIFQILENSSKGGLEKITLTASGGPFLNYSLEDLYEITPEEAVKHPNWSMGAKISIDSATMMNKGLEVIEAYHLFPEAKGAIEVIIHPESIVHGFVHYKDGSVIAGMSNPDMKVPISYALGWPERIDSKTKKLSLGEIGKLTFITPDEVRFPALKLAKLALSKGSSYTNLLNAANEVAVSSFIKGEISFLEITETVERTIEKAKVVMQNSIDDVIENDKEARITARNLIKTRSFAFA